MEKRAVVIGGGVAGVMAARALQKRGISDVILIEKSRSVGGRLATRRIGEGRADHGAQFFTVRTPELQAEVEKWLAAGWVRQWYADPYPRYRGTNGMNGLVKELAAGLQVQLQSRAVSVAKTKRGFTIQMEDGALIEANGVIMTAPAPQTVEILQRGGVAVPEIIAGIAFQPCLVALLVLRGESRLPETGHLIEDLPASVERIVDHQKKGMSTTPIISVYMKGDWSQAHYEAQDEAVLAEILAAVARYIGEDQIVEKQLKRWRYAEAASVVMQPFAAAAAEQPLLIAGDAFLQPHDPAGRTRFESAFLSGLAAGEELAHRLL